MIRGDYTANSLKIREDFQSTEDDNFAEDLFKINLLLPDRKPITKYFCHSHPCSSLFTDFEKYLVEFVEKTKNVYYATVGFETLPFNYPLTQIINGENNSTLQVLADRSIKEITISPALIKRPISYESLSFSDFEITKFLGSGGFSQVFLGRCRIDYQYCALKFIRKDTITSAKKVKML